MMGHEVDFSDLYPPDRFREAMFDTAIRVYAGEIEFARPLFPGRCVQYTTAITEPAIESETVAQLDEYDSVSFVATDVSPSRIGLRWEF